MVPAEGSAGPRIVLAGGGTGGHVFPGLALAEELRAQDPECQLLFAGSPGGLEERAVPEAGWELELLPSVKVKGALGYLKLPFTLLRAVRAAMKVISRFSPQVVVALGGYASFAPAIAAWRRKLPVVVLEQNAIPGRVSRVLARFAVEVEATYPESVEAFAHPERVKVPGNPVRSEILAAAKSRMDRTAGEVLTLLVAGGSQGAKRLNELFIEAVPHMRGLAGRLRVIHLTGRAHYQTARAAAEGLPLNVEMVDFQRDMAALYSEADLVLCRAGATGLAEMAACGLAAVLVPFPFAKDNHQEANARSFERDGAARVLMEGDLDGRRLAEVLLELLDDDAARTAMAAAMGRRGRPQAGAGIASRVLDLCAGGETA
jgi:UDP-N-acetylglucosamine--N-acetylmuramyl-(pentapeptide) pyrophosphoryl-undecaprenol N-acetylglucosamine transferase